MYGRKSDILGTIPTQDPAHGINPDNILLDDDLKTKPWVGMDFNPNRKEILASQRNAPVVVINKGQGPVTTLVPQNESVYASGVVVLPKAGIWGKVGVNG
jgi:hypothetical protein